MDYWKRQTNTLYFKNLDFAMPEQKTHAGTLTIIGGNSGSFRTVAAAAAKAEQIGTNRLYVLLPDSLKKTVPTAPNISFAPAEPSGGFAKSSEPSLLAATDPADAVLIIGDLGRNAETATVVASIVKTITQPIILARDAIDLITPEVHAWIERENLTLLATMPQLQKLFRTIYYPRVITLSQPLNQLIETLHKFTITYPTITIATTHNDQYVTARGGQVVTTPLSETKHTPLSIVTSADLATTIAVYQIRQPQHPLEAATTAILAA